MSPGANNPQLIPLADHDGVQAVMGRDLHEFLGIKAHYKDWFPRMIEYGFSEGQDYVLKNERVLGINNRQYEQANHIISLDMAKEISMIQRTERGKQARQYFLECERQAKNPAALTGPELLAHAVLEANSMIEVQTKQIEELTPAAKSWENLAAPGGDFSVAQAAKVLSRDPGIEMGRNRLFDYLAEISGSSRPRASAPIGRRTSRKSRPGCWRTSSVDASSTSKQVSGSKQIPPSGSLLRDCMSCTSASGARALSFWSPEWFLRDSIPRAGTEDS